MTSPAAAGVTGLPELTDAWQRTEIAGMAVRLAHEGMPNDKKLVSEIHWVAHHRHDKITNVVANLARLEREAGQTEACGDLPTRYGLILCCNAMFVFTVYTYGKTKIAPVPGMQDNF